MLEIGNTHDIKSNTNTFLHKVVVDEMKTTRTNITLLSKFVILKTMFLSSKHVLTIHFLKLLSLS